MRKYLKRYLGLILDNFLTWKDHIKHVQGKILPLIFAIKKARKNLTEKACWTLYHSYIQPHLDYMITVWGNTNETLLRPLKVLQNKVIKFIRKLPLLHPTIDLYNVNLLPLTALYKYEAILFIYKVVNGILKNNVEMGRVSESHSYSTRRGNDIYINFVARTQRCFSNVFFNGARMFNSVPLEIRNLRIKLFKKRLKELLIEEFLMNNGRV